MPAVQSPADHSDVPADEATDDQSDVPADEATDDQSDVPTDEAVDNQGDVPADEGDNAQLKNSKNDSPEYRMDNFDNPDISSDSFNSLSDYMNAHNYGPDDFATVHTNYPRKTTRLFLVCAMRFPAVLVPSTVLYTLFVRHTVWRFSGVRIPPSKYGILSCKLLPACRLVAPIRYK